MTVLHYSRFKTLRPHRRYFSSEATQSRVNIHLLSSGAGSRFLLTYQPTPACFTSRQDHPPTTNPHTTAEE